MITIEAARLIKDCVATVGGGQAYWVCPHVEEARRPMPPAAEEPRAIAQAAFGDDKVGCSRADEGPERMR